MFLTVVLVCAYMYSYTSNSEPVLPRPSSLMNIFARISFVRARGGESWTRTPDETGDSRMIDKGNDGELVDFQGWRARIPRRASLFRRLLVIISLALLRVCSPFPPGLPLAPLNHVLHFFLLALTRKSTHRFCMIPDQ